MIQLLKMYTCGNLTNIDGIIPSITSTLVNVIKIVIPIALIFLGMLDLGKAVIANDEKVMKEAQGRLIKRFIYAILIFLIVAIVQLVFGLLGKNESANATACISCFISGPSSCTSQ